MAIEILGMIVAGAGASWGWWHVQKRRFSRGRRALEAALEDDAQVVFGVAGHAVTSRGHHAMWPLHLMYGLLQDETFTGAIRTLGGDPDAIETKVLAQLDTVNADDEGAADLVRLLNYVFAVAQATERKVSVVDFAVTLLHLDIAAVLEVDVDELRFLLVHGVRQPPPELPDRTDVAVVLRNDNHTTFELVVEILQDVFDVPGAEAAALARQTHTEGRAIIGRYRADVARDKVIAARARARDQGFPLWVGVEDI